MEEKGLTDSFVTLNLDFDFKDNRSTAPSESPRTLSLTEGFEMQYTKGGNALPVAENFVIRKAIDATQLSDSSDESDYEEDSLIDGRETKLLKI